MIVIGAVSAEPIRWCRLKSPLAMHAHVAELAGIYERQKLGVAIEEVNQAKVCIDGIEADRFDVAIAAESVINYVDPVVTKCRLAAITVSGPFVSLVGRIPLKAPAELRGKKIGLLPGTASELAALHAVHEAQLGPRDFIRVVLQPHSWPLALASGHVDLIAGWQPYATQAEQGAGANAWRELSARSVYGFLVVGSRLEKDPRLLKRLLSVLEEAATVISAKPQESLAMVERVSKEPLDDLRKHPELFDTRIRPPTAALETMGRNAELLDWYYGEKLYQKRDYSSIMLSNLIN